MKRTLLKVTRAAKRSRELWADFERANRSSLSSFDPDTRESHEEAIERVRKSIAASKVADASFNSLLKGYARQAGLAARPASKATVLCVALARRFPSAIRKFSAGVPLTNRELCRMVAVVTGKPISQRELNALRQQLKRKFRGGNKAVGLRRGMPKAGPRIARRVDVRNGKLIYREASSTSDAREFDLDAVLPGLRRFKLAK